MKFIIKDHKESRLGLFLNHHLYVGVGTRVPVPIPIFQNSDFERNEKPRSLGPPDTSSEARGLRKLAKPSISSVTRSFKSILKFSDNFAAPR